MPSDLVRIPAGEFLVGSNCHYLEEAPQHRVPVAEFQTQRAPVTNREFTKFVHDTGYVICSDHRLRTDTA